jgi:serine/threonine-protein kinase
MTVPQKLEKIGRYQVLEKVGKGGMGVLYRGFDPVLDREVAIKLMHADFSEDTEQMRPRFYREARAAAKLNHRNIVTIFEFAEESNVPYIVMEFLKGTPLGARIHAQPSLTLDDKLNVVAQLCDGLAYAHEQGVVHRDVKPDNVFLLEDGSVKLLDFGIAKLTTSTLTRQGDVLGSASYMSPEQVGGSDSVDGRADIFSTGVVLYELLSGKKPFEADSPTAVIVKILKDEPTPIESVTTGLPADLIAAVMKALSKDPAERFPTADAFGRELQNIRKNLKPSQSTVPLDETRFASTMVMQQLHEDIKKAKAGAVASGTRTPTSVTNAATRLAPGAEDAPAKKSFVVPAAAAAILVLGIGGYFMFRPGAPPPAAASRPPSAPATTAAATSAAAPAPPADTSAAAPGVSTPAAVTPSAGTPPPAAPATTAPAASSSTAASAPASTAAATRPAATPRPAGAAPAAATPPPAPAALVAVTLTGNYPFEVFDGNRSISSADTSHELKQPAGKSLRLSAPQYFLSQTVRVDGSASNPFDFAAPGLGGLDVRSAQETCDVMIGNRKLGNPPLVIKEIAAGQYKVDLVCAGETVKSHYATVRAGQTYVAAIR